MIGGAIYYILFLCYFYSVLHATATNQRARRELLPLRIASGR
jgi:hypothetical protein